MNTTACPYCNAVIPLADAADLGAARVPCPRCGEAVPLARTGRAPRPAAEPSSSADAAVERVPAPVRARNRRLGLFIGGSMLLLAVVMTVVLVNTRGKRRMTSLAESPALGHLPDDTNLIIMLDMTEANRAESSVDALNRIGFGADGTFSVERLVGLNRDEIETAVLGMRIDRNLIPRLRLVIRTKRELDREALKARVDSRGTRRQGERDYELIRARGLPIEMALWQASARTLIAVYPPEELDLVPADPGQPVERFAPALVNLLKSRPEHDTFFSIVACHDDWSKTTLTTLLLKMNADDRKLLLGARSFGLGMRKDAGVTRTRARPARVTEIPDGDPRAIALDLVFEAAPGADLPAMIGALQDWVERYELMERDARTNGPLHSVVVVGTPDDWQRAFGSIRNLLP